MPTLRAYERLGWCLTPAKGKAPYLTSWPKKALCSADKAAHWLSNGRNLALVTGQRSGVVVVDVDPRNGGERGLYDLENAHGKLPDTLTCNTGGGGLHLYFRHYDGARTSKPAEGIDYQVDRRCVIVPPSVHPDTRNPYQWASDPGQTTIAELPESWRVALSGEKGTPVPLSDGPIPEGRRNQTLFNLARDLYRNGEPESLVRSRIEEANDLRCTPPLEPAEIAQVVAGAYRYRGGGASPLSLLQAAVWRWPMPSIHKLTLLSLASYADTETLKAYPTQEQIAVRAAITDRRVRAVLKDLEADGWFTRSTHRRSQGSGFNYSYQLRVPEVTE